MSVGDRPVVVAIVIVPATGSFDRIVLLVYRLPELTCICTVAPARFPTPMRCAGSLIVVVPAPALLLVDCHTHHPPLGVRACFNCVIPVYSDVGFDVTVAW